MAKQNAVNTYATPDPNDVALNLTGHIEHPTRPSSSIERPNLRRGQLCISDHHLSDPGGASGEEDGSLFTGRTAGAGLGILYGDSLSRVGD
ncbi:MAG: hypothetical protein ABSB35_35815 [Bryobacteraceae bacterium]|jgi:hypothetical protein